MDRLGEIDAASQDVVIEVVRALEQQLWMIRPSSASVEARGRQRELMSPISRGFSGRRRPVADPSRLPPGQYLERGFPVLSAGPTPHTPLDEWSFLINGEVDEPVSWTWEEFLALPAETLTVDIHCVTKWSKFDTRWKGVSVDTLLDGRRRARPRT